MPIEFDSMLQYDCLTLSVGNKIIIPINENSRMNSTFTNITCVALVEDSIVCRSGVGSGFLIDGKNISIF